MQRVKAHELRQKDETALVEDLTKFRVSDTATSELPPLKLSPFSLIIEGIGSA